MSQQGNKDIPPPPATVRGEPESSAGLAERVAALEKRLQIVEDKIAVAVGAEAPAAKVAESGASFDLEHRLASPFLNYLGLVALLVGLALLIGSWMEARPWAAILLAGLSAVALAALAQWMQRRGSEGFSLTLEGTALGLIYIACYLLHVWVGFVLSLLAGALVMVLAMGRALQRNSQLVATFALLAALLGPLLVRSVQSGESLLFGYLAAVNAGAVWMGRRKGWIGLRLLALLGSHVVAWFWYWSHPAVEPLLTAAFPVLTFVLFAAVVPTAPLGLAEVALGLANTAGFLAASASLLHVYQPSWVAWTPLAVAGVHLLWGLEWHSSATFAPYRTLHWWLAGVLFAAGLVFAMPLEVVAMGWIAQGLLLSWLGARQNRLAWRSAANLLGLAAAAATVVVLRSSEGSLATLAAVGFCASVVLRHRWIKQYAIGMGNWEWAAHWLLLVAATLLPMPAMSREISLRSSTLFSSVAPPLVTSILWAAYSVALCLVGWFWFSTFLRWIGVAFLLMTTLKVFLVDPVILSGLSRILSFLMLSLFLLLLSYLFQTRRPG